MTGLVARIEGYASLFNVADLNGDIVSPGAFRKSLKLRPAGEVKLLYQHAPEAPLGRWLSFEEDARGLYAAGELILSSETAREVHALIAGGAIDGLSIGFRTVRAAKHERNSRRFILEADLWEVSIVTFPMAPGARIARLGEPEPAGRKTSADEALFADALKGAARMLAPEARGVSSVAAHSADSPLPLAGEGLGVRASSVGEPLGRLVSCARRPLTPGPSPASGRGEKASAGAER